MEGKMQTRIINIVICLLPFILVASNIQAQLKCELTNDPSKVEVVYEDVVHFLHAFDQLDEDSDSMAILQKEYIKKATPGFKAYINESGLTAGDYVKALNKRPAQYAGLVDLPNQLAVQQKNVRKGLAKLKNIITDAKFMPSYIFIGTKSGSNSQPSEYGLMTAIGNLDNDIDKLYIILVHETVHVQNALKVGMEEYQSALGGPKTTLLSLTLREGVAYYFTLHSTGVHTHQKAFDYYLKNEEDVWKRFAVDMNKRVLNGWMFEKPSDPDQPIDVGYVIGYRIVEAYYNNAKNKEKAVHEILSITDFPGFLEKSGYALKFSGQ
jgi:hypothetical protein